MVEPEAGFFVVSLFFGPEIGEDQKKRSLEVQPPSKKDLHYKITGFSMRIRLETKQNEKTRSSPQISGVLVSHHNMLSSRIVSPGRPPPL